MNPTQCAKGAFATAVAISLFALEPLAEPVILDAQLEAQFGGGSVRDWRNLDEDTLFLTGPTGHAILKLSSNEIIYGDLNDPTTRNLLDYDPGSSNAIIAQPGESISVIDTVADKLLWSRETSEGKLQEARFLPNKDTLYLAINNLGTELLDANTGELLHSLGLEVASFFNVVSESGDLTYTIDTTATYTNYTYARWRARRLAIFDNNTGTRLFDASQESGAGSLFIDRGYILWANSWDSVSIIEMDTGEIRTVNLEHDDIELMRIHPNGELLGALYTPEAPGADERLVLVDIGDSSIVADINEKMADNSISGEIIHTFDFSAFDQHLYTLHDYDELRYWETTAGAYQGTKLSAELKSPISFHISPNGRFITLRDQAQFPIYDLETDSKVGIAGESNIDFRRSFSADSSRYFSILNYNLFQSMSTSDGTVQLQTTASEGTPLSVSPINGGSQLAAFFDSRDIIVFDAESLETVSTIPDVTSVASRLPVHDPNSGRYVTTGSREIQVHDANTKTTVAEFPIDFFTYPSMTISSNASRVSFTNTSKTVLNVYQTDNASLLYEESFDSRDLLNHSLSYDGTSLVLFLKSQFSNTFKIARVNLDDGLSRQEFYVPISRFTGSSVDKYALSDDGSQLCILDVVYSDSSISTNVTARFIVIDMDSEAIVHHILLKLKKNISQSYRYLNKSGDKLIAGDSETGDFFVIDPYTGSYSRGFDSLPIDVPAHSVFPRPYGAVFALGEQRYSTLGQDGILCLWDTTSGTSVSVSLAPKKEGLIGDMKTTPGSTYWIRRGSNLGNLDWDAEPLIASEEQMNLDIESPKDEPVFLQVFEISEDN